MTKKLKPDPIENHMYKISNSVRETMYNDQEKFARELTGKLKEIAFILDDIQEWKAAAAVADVILRRMPDLHMAAGCARWYYEIRDYKKSLKYLEFALNHDTKNPEVRLNYARVLISINKQKSH